MAKIQTQLEVDQLLSSLNKRITNNPEEKVSLKDFLAENGYEPILDSMLGRLYIKFSSYPNIKTDRDFFKGMSIVNSDLQINDHVKGVFDDAVIENSMVKETQGNDYYFTTNVLYTKKENSFKQADSMYQLTNIGTRGICFGLTCEYIRQELEFDNPSKKERKLVKIDNTIKVLDNLIKSATENPEDLGALKKIIEPIEIDKSSFKIRETLKFTINMIKSESGYGYQIADLQDIRSEIVEDRRILTEGNVTEKIMRKFRKLVYSDAFKERISIYQRNLQEKMFNPLPIGNASSMIDAIFGNDSAIGVAGESKMVGLSFDSSNDGGHIIAVTKRDDGGYNIFDPNYGLFEGADTKEGADRVIKGLVKIYNQLPVIKVAKIDEFLQETGIVGRGNRVNGRNIAKYGVAFSDIEKSAEIRSAINTGDNKLLKDIISSMPENEKITSYIYPDGSNMMHYAATRGRVTEDIIKTLIDAGLDVNSMNENHPPPFIMLQNMVRLMF